jgi:hypothetical protein
MHLRNAEGRAVDPVPFFVMALSAWLVSLSFGPFYLRFWGLGLDVAILGSGILGLACCLGAYYRYVWTYRPGTRGEVPVASRMARIAYGMVIFALLLGALSLPFWL